MIVESKKPFRYLSVLLILLVGGLIYSNSFYGEFHFDDIGYILKNPAFKKPYNNIIDIYNNFSWKSYNIRFVSFLSLFINYNLHGEDVFGYHFVNFTLHIISAFLVWWITLLTLNLPSIGNVKLREHRGSLAVMTALLFISHPIQTQAVSYIVQRFASMATMFYLLALALYIKARTQNKFGLGSVGLFVGCAVSAMLGMWSKEIAFTLPIMIIIYEFFFLNNLDLKEWLTRSLKSPYFIVTTLFMFVVPLLWLPYFHIVFKTSFSQSHDGDLISPFSYLLTQFSVVATYIKLLFLPIGQNLDYDYPVVKHVLELPTLLSIVFLAIIFIFGLRMYSKNKLITFGVLWFFITLSVESSIIPIRNVIFEHRVYLPSYGFSLALAVGLFSIIAQYKRYMQVGGLIILTLMYLTYQRNEVWKTEESLWKDVLKKSPNKSRPYTNLGLAYYEKGQYDLAKRYFNIALDMNPEREMAYANRGDMYQDLGKYDLALKDYQEALNRNPSFIEVYNNRGNLYRTIKKYKLALADYDYAIELNPAYLSINYPEIYNNRGLVHKVLGHHDRAIEDYNQAIAMKHDYAEAYSNRSLLYYASKQYDLALKDINKAIELDPLGFPEFFNNRGVIFKAQGQLDLALEDYQRALSIEINNADSYNNIGSLYMLMNDYDQALTHFNKALEVNSNHVLAYFNRFLVHQSKSQYELALQDILKAKSLGYMVNDNIILQLQQTLSSNGQSE